MGKRKRIKGLNKLEKSLEKMQETVNELAQGVEVPLSELIGEGLLDKLADELGITTEKELDNASKEDLDAFTARHTEYTEWQEMIDEKAAELVMKRLMEGRQ